VIADHSFQINTDGFILYKDAIVYRLGGKHVNFAQIIKVFGKPEGDEKDIHPAKS
jgi:hypothetical protein